MFSGDTKLPISRKRSHLKQNRFRICVCLAGHFLADLKLRKMRRCGVLPRISHAETRAGPNFWTNVFATTLCKNFLLVSVIEPKNHRCRNWGRGVYMYALSKGRRNWVPVNRDDIWAFLGIILYMGIVRISQINRYWSRRRVGQPAVKECMTQARFWSIWSNLHVVDNSQLPVGAGLSDKLGEVLTVLGDTFATSYLPGQELCVDESMIKYKGKVKRGRVSMPRKPIKKGFKVWCCCCACCGYLHTFRVYGGKPASGTERGLVMKVVQDLLDPFEGLNHVVYMDNYFTSGSLVDVLASKQIYTAGTIKQRSEGFPESLKGIELPPGGFASEKVGDTCYYTFRDRKLVSLVTNAFPTTMKKKVARLPPDSKTLCYQHVPPVLPAYNKYMGGVDRLNQLRKTYGFDRKSKRYWIRAFMAFLDCAVVNAHILYRQNCRRYKVKPLGSFDFRMELAEKLLTRRRRKSVSVGVSLCVGDTTTGLCTLVRVRDIRLCRGRCALCKSRSTTFACGNCRVRLCKIPCYDAYHRH